MQKRVPAVFMRGGSSKGVFFRSDVLPDDPDERDRLFLAVLGSPDPYGRQLDGMGGGISSLSKVAIVGASNDPDADIDFTFAQVDVHRALVDYSATCGNLSSAVGPFAVEEGLAAAAGPEVAVRIHNTNTGKNLVARFEMDHDEASVEGDFRLAGVSGSGAQIRLEFLDPGGAATSRLLPSGNALDRLDVAGIGRIDASLVDATNACVFIRAVDIGLSGTETPAEIEADHPLLDRIEAIRAVAAVTMGLVNSPDEATASAPSSPKIAIVAPPLDATTLDGTLQAGDVDVTVRMMSMGSPHRVVPLTGGMCLAVAARIPGTIVHSLTRQGGREIDDIRVGTPSGVVPVAAIVKTINGQIVADRVVVYRTARRLMEGNVVVPSSRL